MQESIRPNICTDFLSVNLNSENVFLFAFCNSLAFTVLLHMKNIHSAGVLKGSSK